MLTFFISVVLFLMFYDLYKLHLGFVKYKYSGPFLLSCNNITVADTPPPPPSYKSYWLPYSQLHFALFILAIRIPMN